MKALVTAFDAFGGDAINASEQALALLPVRLGALEIARAVLPTSFARAGAELVRALERERPQLVLCLGQAEQRAMLSLERVALNLQDARIPDNDGAQPVDAPVVAGGPAAYLATLPLRKALGALRAAGLPAELSYSAGTFVCNHVFYGLMHALALERSATRAGFMHVPALPALEASELARGAALVLEASA